jgi:hypothetical protein
MKYGNHEFAPNGKFDKKRFKELSDLDLKSRTELKMWDEYFARAYYGRFDHGNIFVTL